MSGIEVQVSDHDQLWTAVAQLLRAQVSEAVWFSTFQDVTALDSDPSMLRVGAREPRSDVTLRHTAAGTAAAGRL